MNLPLNMPRLMWVLTAAGIALLALGVVLWGSAPAEFGWFSYGPVDEQFLSQLVFMSGRRWLAVASAVSGLMMLAGTVGLRIGYLHGQRTTS